MLYFKTFFTTVFVVKNDMQVVSRSKVFQSDNGKQVVLLNFVIISFINESQCQHALFLQIRFVDAGKTLCQDNTHIQETRLHSSMFAAGTFAIVFLGHNNRRNSLRFIKLRRTGYGSIGIGRTVPYFVRFSIESVDRPHQHIIRNVFQVTAEAEPRTCHRNMVGSTLALCLNQQRHVQ